MEQLLCQDQSGICIAGEAANHAIQPDQANSQVGLVQGSDQLLVEWAEPRIATLVELTQIPVVRQPAPALHVGQPPCRQSKVGVQVEGALEMALRERHGFPLKGCLAPE